MRSILVGIFVFSVLSAAYPCSPVQHTDVFFQENEIQLSSVELRKLAFFSVAIKTQYPNHELLMVSGAASTKEVAADELAAARAAVVADYFRRTGYDRAPIQQLHAVYPLDTANPATYMRAEIDFLPAPPHACNAGK